MVEFSEANAIRHNYKAKMTSRAHFLAPEERSEMAEFFGVQVHSAFADPYGMMILVQSDVGRHYEQVYFSKPANDKTSWTPDQRDAFRHTFEVIAREGLIGHFFTITVQKVIPDTGIFDHFGADLEMFAVPEYNAEQEVGLGGLTENY